MERLLEKFVPSVSPGVSGMVILLAVFGPVVPDTVTIIGLMQAGIIAGSLALNLCLINLLFATLVAEVLMRKIGAALVSRSMRTGP